MQSDLAELENRLWDAADELRANSGLNASEYGTPVLGLIFLRFADAKFQAAREEIEAKASARRRIGPSDYHAQRVIYLTEAARFSYLLDLPEGSDLGKATNEAMRLVEENNPELAGVLPRTYTAVESSTIASLLRHINSYTKDIEGDAFGLIYEYFLAKFALAEGQGAGEFFTPMAIVRLIVEIIEPFHGRIFDPACGSGGMFVHSAHFVKRHSQSPGEELSIYGQEKTGETVRLARMNLAVHGLSGEIREGNSYYEDLHDTVGRFDFVMANPPFNVDRIDKAKLDGDARFPDLPRADNGNYLWIQLFATALNETGRAGFVMANSSSDARHSEGEIRRKLIEDRVVDVMVFDLLTQPDPVLTDEQREEVKLIARKLMDHIEEKLVLDWRKKAETRETARGLVKDILDELPDAYDPETWERKTEIVFNHIFASYYDDGHSVYEEGGAYAEEAGGIAVAAAPPAPAIDVDEVTTVVLDQIRGDPEFAAKVAEQLRGRAGFFAVESRELISGEETHQVELKSTARWNLREQCKDERMEDAVVKTVAGFLNTEGGTLLIGVDDARQPIGLSHDLPLVKPQNPDGLVNWLTTHLTNALTHTAVLRTRARIDVIEGVDLCRVDIARSSAPVMARMSDKAEVFWVRMNNSTRALPEIELDRYVKEHWA